MKTLLAAAASFAVAGAAVAATAQTGTLTSDCQASNILDGTAGQGELYGIRVSAAAGGGNYDDMLWDTRATGGTQVGGANIGDASTGWLLPPNWTTAQGNSDVHWAIVTWPPAGGSQANRISISSGTILNIDQGANTQQTIGDSLPSYGGVTQTIGIALPGTSAPYSVKTKGPASAASAIFNFPHPGMQSIDVAFAPLADKNGSDPTGQGFCEIAGVFPNPDPSGNLNGGIILGYNVYRLQGAAGTPPTTAQFFTASKNAVAEDGWQYFLPLTSSFNLTGMDTSPAGPGTPAPTDTVPNDLGGLQNPDGIMYNGDEVMFFQDAASNRGVARPANAGTPPVPGTGYWYAFQPVIYGSVANFGPAFGFGGGGLAFNGEHRVDTNGDTIQDSVNLDLDAGARLEFFSPQANAAMPGLGLTWNGMPALSNPVFAQFTPAAAGGQVSLSATVSGTDVNITFQTGMEQGTVSGFNVYRVVGSTQTKINDAQIPAQGNESNVYRLVDDATQARRLAKGGVFQYSVEIVHTDGTTQMVGPFDVTLERAAPARRHR